MQIVLSLVVNNFVLGGGTMLNDCKKYIRHIKMRSKKLWIVFWLCLICLLVTMIPVAIFSPDSRRFAIGMIFMALTFYGFILFAGFLQFRKGKSDTQ